MKTDLGSVRFEKEKGAESAHFVRDGIVIRSCGSCWYCCCYRSLWGYLVEMCGESRCRRSGLRVGGGSTWALCRKREWMFDLREAPSAEYVPSWTRLSTKSRTPHVRTALSVPTGSTPARETPESAALVLQCMYLGRLGGMTSVVAHEAGAWAMGTGKGRLEICQSVLESRNGQEAVD